MSELEQSQQAPRIPADTGQTWESSLNKIYGLPASVTVVKGPWKTGKTDFATHVTEELKRLKLISVAGSNIQYFKDKECTTTSNDDIEYIDNFVELEGWMFSGYRKAFLYDEAIKSSPSRRAMSTLNTKWLEVIPELSKGRMHLIVITQETEYTEKSFLHPTFIRATWEKLDLPEGHPQFRKMVRLKSNLLPWPRQCTFRNIPPTHIVFDPYKSANFKLMPDMRDNPNLILELKVCKDYADGLSTDDIVDKYKPDIRDRTQATRALRKGLKILIDKLQVASNKRWIKDEQSVQLSKDS